MRKKVLVVTGMMLALFMAAPAINSQAVDNIVGVETSYAAELSQSARWVGTGDRWQVSDNAGGFIKNCWFQDDVTGHWYLLGAEDGSVMYAGLVTDQSTGKTYLLNTNHDGTYGRMISVNGTYNLNGKQVYLTFNQNHDGTFGAITSGLSEARSSGIAESRRDSIPTDSGVTSTQKSQSVPQVDISKMTDEEYMYDYLGFDRPSEGSGSFGYNDSNTGRVVGQ